MRHLRLIGEDRGNDAIELIANLALVCGVRHFHELAGDGGIEDIGIGLSVVPSALLLRDNVCIVERAGCLCCGCELCIFCERAVLVVSVLSADYCSSLKSFVFKPGLEIGAGAGELFLTAGVVTLILAFERGVKDDETVVRYGRLMEVPRMVCAEVVVCAAVGGEHSLVVDLECTGVTVLVVCGGELLDSEDRGCGVGIIPSLVYYVLTERIAVILNEIHSLVSVLAGCELAKAAKYDVRRRAES